MKLKTGILIIALVACTHSTRMFPGFSRRMARTDKQGNPEVIVFTQRECQEAYCEKGLDEIRGHQVIP